jgi:catechol 2,3-dioxygenase-like lactoylglutathione lyase family enzyme
VKAHRISAVLCSGDLARSQTFYEQVVGLTLSADTVPNHLLFKCGDGTTILVYGRPAPNKADHTQVRFWTDDVSRDVRELESRGAVFQD